MKIQQILVTSIYILLILSCNKEKSIVNYALFSGKITNSEESEITVYGNENNFQKAIKINSDGSFSDTLKIESTGSYGFIIGPERSTMHLQQGDRLNLSINIKQFHESIKYTGIGADANNYLAEKFLINENFMAKGPEAHKNLYIKEPEDFKKYVQEQKQTKNNVLKKYKNLDSRFEVNEGKNNHYEYLSKLNYYLDSHRYYTKKQDFQTPKGFLDELKDFDIDNPKDFEISGAYRQLSIQIFDKISFEKAKKDSIPVEKAMIQNLAQIKTEKIKDLFIKNIATRVSIRNKNAAELYEMIMEVSEDEEFKKELTTKFEKIKDLVNRTAKGEDSPLFTNYENFKGGTTSLSDISGKYVYIDVWATWCGPCKTEIPYLKKIKKSYHGRNIEFVSISIDKKAQYNTWKKMVEEKELGGIQLFADNDWESQFVTDYGIRGIPRFILIDPDGKIVNAFAPRPSNPKLITIFEELNV